MGLDERLKELHREEEESKEATRILSKYGFPDCMPDGDECEKPFPCHRCGAFKQFAEKIKDAEAREDGKD